MEKEIVVMKELWEKKRVLLDLKNNIFQMLTI